MSGYQRDNRDNNRSRSYGDRPYNGGGRGNNSFGGRGGGRSRGGFNRRSSFRRNTERINENMYINKAQPIVDKEIYTPSFSFDQLSVNPILKQNLLNKGFNTPTPIQDQSITHILEGKDILGIANTGTGKTGAFLIPLIDRLIQNRGRKSLIITPTRELAEQINNELFTLAKGLQLFSVECTGGNSIHKQINNIRRGFNFLVGTPGRLMDLQERGVIDFGKIEHLVLDEVDRMLDMGFIDPINQIIDELPAEKQTLFFSATMNRKVEDLIGNIMQREYIKVSVKVSDTSQNVEQDVVRYRNVEEKIVLLEEILQKDEASKVVVFVNTKRYVDKLDRVLYDKGFKVTSIHGDKRQRERSRSIERFKKGQAEILIATDVAARGLDIADISHVINFDEPNSYDDYAHRIGRTGRADKSGVALTFVPSR